MKSYEMAISKRFQRGILPAAAARAPDEEGPGPAGAAGSAGVIAATDLLKFEGNDSGIWPQRR